MNWTVYKAVEAISISESNICAISCTGKFCVSISSCKRKWNTSGWRKD